MVLEGTTASNTPALQALRDDVLTDAATAAGLDRAILQAIATPGSQLSPSQLYELFRHPGYTFNPTDYHDPEVVPQIEMLIQAARQLPEQEWVRLITGPDAGPNTGS